MEPLRTAPETSSFIPLADHQSRTPSSFHSGPAVLHYHSKQCKLVIPEHDLVASSTLNAIRGPAATVNGSDGHAPTATAESNANGESDGKEIVLDNVDIWVTSDKFLLYNPSVSAGVSIPYPSISLHAIQRLRLPDTSDTELQGLYMQIAKPEPPTRDDDEEESMTITIVPPTDTDTATEDLDDNKPKETPTQALYAAVSACSNLHPDPMEEDDEDEEENSLFQSGIVSMGSGDGGLPPPVEGSSGWITAENMHEYFDEEGNWIASGEGPTLPLGPGAGIVRPRDEESDGQDGEIQGEDQGEETKWRRTD
ncbi:hypothetical protein EYZ11_000161 [Aspergillus tanneri]|uniref:Regulator of volume decrease after cellular swelling-domain-containing protein n=1 Tax=Aspergillus tanneri TaxID=1220188 RepID=A0A4S3JYE3_9EURO|nr:uncharacterized protein ATNIH1004_005701 [Aspergillus tanneri]KAA8647018.1 hypothetical protein ATNIH1004_005701 [Aspergillus tanneri]THD00434.1 hypothetical protein EYZ11_000161 [Aspergillus tanneri]